MKLTAQTPKQRHLDLHQIMAISPVIPVVIIDDPDKAVPLAKALLDGGVGVIEVTLRTAAGVESIERISREVPQMCVGAGTVWTKQAARQVRRAGAEFIVTPGRADAVYKYCVKHDLPLLPGTQTTSEIAVWVERGLEAVKFFPAEASGGVAALKAFSSVFDGIKFCPTGGVNTGNAKNYLALPSVACVGGSWLVDKKSLDGNNWSDITSAAQQASRLTDSHATEQVDSHTRSGTREKPSGSDSPPWD